MSRAGTVLDVLSPLAGLAPRTVRTAFPPPPCDPGAAIAGAGIEEHRSSRYHWHGLSRERDELVVVQHTLAGAGRLEFAGGLHELPPGATMIVPVPHDHRYWCPDGGEWRFCWVMLTGREAVRILRWVVDRHGPVLRLDPQGTALAALARTCAHALGHAWDSPWSAAGDAWTLVTALAGERLAAADGLPDAVHRAQSFARAHPGVGVAAMARAAGLTRSHFCRVFQAATGQAPSQWLADLRLREAMALLRSGVPAAEAGRRCGFADASAFGRAFRLRLGLSPGAYAAGRDPQRAGPPPAANHPSW